MQRKTKPGCKIKTKKLKLQQYRTKFKALDNPEHKIQKVEMVELVNISKTINDEALEETKRRHRCGFSKGMFNHQQKQANTKNKVKNKGQHCI